MEDHCYCAVFGADSRGVLSVNLTNRNIAPALKLARAFARPQAGFFSAERQGSNVSTLATERSLQSLVVIGSLQFLNVPATKLCGRARNVETISMELAVAAGASSDRSRTIASE